MLYINVNEKSRYIQIKIKDIKSIYYIYTYYILYLSISPCLESFKSNYTLSTCHTLINGFGAELQSLSSLHYYYYYQL